MHTSWSLFGLFIAGIALAIAAQVLNYFATPKEGQNRKRKWGLGIGLLGAVVAGFAGWKLATDWGNLPLMSVEGAPEGVRIGELFDTGGIAAIKESPQRMAEIHRLQALQAKQPHDTTRPPSDVPQQSTDPTVTLSDAPHAVSRGFEDFADRHQHGIAAVSAFGTVMAVIVALFTSQRAMRAAYQPQLKMRVDVMEIFNDAVSGSGTPYVTLQVDNIGNVPVRLRSTSFAWWMPFSGERWWWIVGPADEIGSRDGLIMRQYYPSTVSPHTSSSMVLTAMEQFKRDQVPRMLDKSKLPRFLAARWIKAYITLDGGGKFKADIGAELRKEIRSAAAGTDTAAGGKSGDPPQPSA
jgi:hypothetical protein